MTAPLVVQFKLRVVIEFLVAENVKPVEIYRRLFVVYGNKISDLLFIVGHYRLKVLKLKGYYC